MKMILIIFQKKKLGATGPFWSQNGDPHNFGSAVRVFCKFYTIKRADER